jgi:hypothetical protein
VRTCHHLKLLKYGFVFGLSVMLIGCSPSSMLSAKPGSTNSFGSKTVGASLMSGEQMMRSMSNVTKTEINSTITNEFNSRKTLMTGNFAVDSVTSPMMVSITNLASRFCESMINREAAQNSNERRLLKSVDFTKPLTDLSEAQFGDAMNKMGASILGRNMTTDEIQILSESRKEFEANIPTANRTQSAQTKLLLLFSCSGLMSTFDFVTI